MSKISSKELFVFTFFLSIVLFPGLGNTFILKMGKNSSIIAMMISFIIGLIPILLISYMIKKANGKSVFSYNQQKFKIIGLLFNIIYILAIIYVIFVESWDITTFTISQFLSRTSYYLILFLLSSLLSFIIIKKLEVIGRTSIILFIIFTLIFLFMLIFLIPVVEYENFLPLFDSTKSNFVKTFLLLPSFTIVPLISIFSIKKDDIKDYKNISKAIILGYTFGFLVSLIFIVLVIGVFGIDMSILFTYPEYSLLKKINAFNFIQRIENFIASIFIISAFCSLAILFYSLTIYIKETFKIKKDLILNLITIFLCFAIPFISIYLFKNYIIIEVFTKFPLITSFIYIVIFINFILMSLKKKSD